MNQASNLNGEAAAFARLLSGVYARDAEARAPLADAELARRLAAPVPADIALADWAAVRLADDESLSAIQHGVLATTESIVSVLLSRPAFDPKLAGLILPVRGVLAAAALPADGWITNPQHPARAVLTSLYGIACGWQPEPGLAATREQMARWLESTVSSGGNWPVLAADITAWLAAEHARTEKLERRLLDAEAGLMRTRRARQVSARMLNQSLGDRLIPADVITALHEDWFPAMQWAVLQEGEHGSLWQRVKRVTGTLRWTLQPEFDNEESRQKFLRLMGQVNDDLEALCAHMLRDETSRQRLLDTISAAHFAALTGQDIERIPFPPVDGQDELAGNVTEVSATLLAPVKTLATGQWFLLRDGNDTRRVRLALRHDDTRQLLFTNALCAKALQTSFESFALQLANGDALPLPATPGLDKLIAGIMQDLQRRHAEAQQSRLEKLQLARQRAAAEARDKEIARQKAIAEAQSLETARQTSQRQTEQARQQADAERQSVDAAQEAIKNQRRQRARLLANSLPLGSWLGFPQSDGTNIRRKLTVILSSSGKFILVDVDGTGRFELPREELITGLVDGSIQPLDKTLRLDDV